MCCRRGDGPVSGHCRQTAPGYPDAHANLGVLPKHQDKLDEAVAGRRQAVALKPDHAEACFNLGRLLPETGKIEASIAAYRRALVVDPWFLRGPRSTSLLRCWRKETRVRSWRSLRRFSIFAFRSPDGNTVRA